MKRSIPSRVCDRCGKVYQMYVRGQRPPVAFHARLRVLKEGKVVGSMDVTLRDLCDECGPEVGSILEKLQRPKEDASE